MVTVKVSTSEDNNNTASLAQCGVFLETHTHICSDNKPRHTTVYIYFAHYVIIL
jgi:hypothetical protein